MIRMAATSTTPATTSSATPSPMAANGNHRWKINGRSAGVSFGLRTSRSHKARPGRLGEPSCGPQQPRLRLVLPARHRLDPIPWLLAEPVGDLDHPIGQALRRRPALTGLVQFVAHRGECGQHVRLTEVVGQPLHPLGDLLDLPVLRHQHLLLGLADPGRIGAEHRAQMRDTVQPAHQPVPSPPVRGTERTEVPDLRSVEDPVLERVRDRPFLQIVQQRQRDVRPEPEELERRTALLRCPGRRAPRHDLHLERGPDQVPADGRDQPGERVPEGALHLQVLEDAAQPDRDRFRPAGQTQLQVGLGEPFGQRVPHRLCLHQAVAGRLQSLLQLIALRQRGTDELCPQRAQHQAYDAFGGTRPPRPTGVAVGIVAQRNRRAVRIRNPGMLGSEDLVDVLLRQCGRGIEHGGLLLVRDRHRLPHLTGGPAARVRRLQRLRRRAQPIPLVWLLHATIEQPLGVGPGRVRLQQQPLELLDVGRGSPPPAGTARPTTPPSTSFGVSVPTSSVDAWPTPADGTTYST